MEISDLPLGSAPLPLEYRHFPARWQAFLWRNWPMIPSERLANVLACSTEVVIREAKKLGLPIDFMPSPLWLTKGYLTVIRANWHLLNYEQLLQLLEWTPEHLEHVLNEEDFFWIKLGFHKPKAEPLRYEPLTAETQAATAVFRERLLKNLPEPLTYVEEPFAFASQYRTTGNPPPAQMRFPLNFIHSYAASCGDIFLDIDANDPVPENLLRKYAEMGIQGVWMHAILYLLHPIEGAEEFSEGYKTRLANLKRLVRKCAKYGLKIFLYLNEPRGMPYSFYEKKPEWAGVDIALKYMRCNCTSNPGPLEWLREASAAVFREVPGLGGVFCITMSENPTHCNSRMWGYKCPRCSKRPQEDLIIEVVKALADGIHSVAPEAVVMAEDWSWKDFAGDDSVEHTFTETDVIRKLPEDVWLMCVSEWGKELNIGGTKGMVRDYSISQVGPSQASQEAWRQARERGLKTCAKIQINNSWELSSLPYLPVPYLLQEHLEKLKQEGIDGLLLSWTLGGYPGGNLELLGFDSVEEMAAARFSADIAPRVCRAWKCFSDAFRNYPFDLALIYYIPASFGPANLFYWEKTGYQATMVGVPYDDLESWRSLYPAAIVEEQFRIMTEEWRKGMDILEEASTFLKTEDEEPFAELKILGEAAYCHLRSAYLQVRFVQARDAGRLADMEPIVREELELTRRLFCLVRRDSRLGFEASNHYYFTLGDLGEKMVNCEYVLDKLKEAGIHAF